MKHTFRTVAVLTILAAAIIPMSGAVLEADYQFQGSYSSSVGAIPDLTVVGSAANLSFVSDTVNGQTQTVLQVTNPSGKGNDTGLEALLNGFVTADDYSIVIYAKYGVVNGIATKLIDFKNLTADTGLYNNNGSLDFYNEATAIGGTPSPDQYTQIVLTRTGSNNLVVAYVDGVEAFSFTDSSNLGVADDPNSTDAPLVFFKDDNSSTAGLGDNTIAGTSGNIARIRLYDGPLTAAEVAALDTVAPIPEPATWVLMVLGLASLVGWRRFAPEAKLRRKLS